MDPSSGATGISNSSACLLFAPDTSHQKAEVQKSQPIKMRQEGWNQPQDIGHRLSSAPSSWCGIANLQLCQHYGGEVLDLF